MGCLRTRATIALVIAAALASGALLFAATPYVGAGPLAWFALVPAAAVAIRHWGTPAGRIVIPLAYTVYLELMFIPALPFGLTKDQWGDDPVVPILIGDSPVLITTIVIVPSEEAKLSVNAFEAGTPIPISKATTAITTRSSLSEKPFVLFSKRIIHLADEAKNFEPKLRDVTRHTAGRQFEEHFDTGI